MVESLILSILIFIGIIGYLAFHVKKKHYTSLFVAFLISLSWVVYYGYNYAGTNIFVLGKINIFALLAWTAGLMLLLQVYFWLRKKTKNKWKALGISYLIYLALIVPIEWFGYNVLKIKLASSFNGLFNLPLMHGTPILKAYYLTAGGLYLLILILLGEIK